MIFLLPAVKIKNPQHPVVRFCMHLRLWSKPSPEAGAMTASLIGGLMWVVFAVVLFFSTRDLKIFFTICGCLDVLGRALGMKSTFYFIPIWALAILGNFIFGDVSLDFDKEPDPITFNAPRASKVKEISAQLYKRSEDEPGLESFKIPTESHQLFLKALDGALETENPVKWSTLGSLTIVLENASFKIKLYRTNKKQGAFQVNRTYYRGSSDEEFTRLILDAAKQP